MGNYDCCLALLFIILVISLFVLFFWLLPFILGGLLIHTVIKQRKEYKDSINKYYPVKIKEEKKCNYCGLLENRESAEFCLYCGSKF